MPVRSLMLTKIIPGGQTGADQAGLDVAIKLDIPHGGWIPNGRMTEAGPLPEKYKLQGMTVKSFTQRNEKNVLDSDGTLIVSTGKLTGGSKLRVSLAQKHGKHFLHLDFKAVALTEATQLLASWASRLALEVLPAENS